MVEQKRKCNMVMTHRDILNPQLDLSETLLLVAVVEIGKRELDDSALERVVGVLCRVSAKGFGKNVLV